MPKTATPTRARLAQQRTDARYGLLAAEGRMAGLLADQEAAARERASFDRAHINLADTNRVEDVFPPGVQGPVKYGGTIAYHQGRDPDPATIAAAQADLDERQHQYEEAERRLAAAPEDPDPADRARAAGCRFFARQSFDLADRHYDQGDPVEDAVLAQLQPDKLRALRGRGSYLAEVWLP